MASRVDEERERRGRWAWNAAAITVAVRVAGTLIWRHLYRPVARFDLGNGRTISIWSEWHFDGLGTRMLMGEVRDARGALGRPCYLGEHWPNKPLEFRLVFADERNLACVY